MTCWKDTLEKNKSKTETQQKTQETNKKETTKKQM